jgi:F0F1-type ATP synthase membrane subunit c/vacuolar-type H+-ATPase subunit K
MKNFTQNPVKQDTVDPDKENFRTSMFIMAFLSIPVLLALIVAFIVRLKNMSTPFY